LFIVIFINYPHHGEPLHCVLITSPFINIPYILPYLAKIEKCSSIYLWRFEIICINSITFGDNFGFSFVHGFF